MPISTMLLLKNLWHRLSDLPAGTRLAVLGVGQELCGDDAAGVLVARQLAAQLASRLPQPSGNLLVLETGTAPENFTGPLRRFSPGLVLLVDAAEMGEKPGVVRVLPASQAPGFGGSTHTLPLYLVAGYITSELGCPVDLVGIQPQQNAPDAPLSPAVEAAVSRLIESLLDWHSASLGLAANL